MPRIIEKILEKMHKNFEKMRKMGKSLKWICMCGRLEHSFKVFIFDQSFDFYEIKAEFPKIKNTKKKKKN